MISLAEVELQEVRWLWKPYIPFGKITIIQGDPGEGKTTLALRLAAACSTGKPMPGMEVGEPFNVIYQTAEDGLGDTIKPRLLDAGADQSRIFNIVEAQRTLTLVDERIERAILQTGAKLMILDPIQGYLGSRVDMNRANEIRTVLKGIASVADRTGCAIVLVGHLNKASGASSAYRGLGSIDFRAAAEELIREMLSDGRQIPCDTIFTMAQAKGISRRTVNEAKKNIPDIHSRKIGKQWYWQLSQ